jgi:hypothetical protein
VTEIPSEGSRHQFCRVKQPIPSIPPRRPEISELPRPLSSLDQPRCLPSGMTTSFGSHTCET